MNPRLASAWSSFGIRFSVLLICLMCVIPACVANPYRNEEGQIARDLKIHVYEWSDADIEPRGVVVALHGLIMHGGTFNELAKNLVANGYLVYALDMRGYGRWYQEAGGEKIDYEQSQKDLNALARKLRQQHPQLPLFYVGESLGADMAIRLAAKNPELVDGLILSSPAIRSCSVVRPKFFAEMAMSVVNPLREIDLVPYIRLRASNDQRIVEEIVNDPMVRKVLTTGELFRSRQQMHSTLPYIRQVNPKTPVLVIQGSADRTVKANAVVLLLERLRSVDQTVRWLPQYGHILLETAYVDPDTLKTISSWLQQHTPKLSPVQSARSDISRFAVTD